MSDDDSIKNRGVTLPDGENATHNISLAPLFLNRSGDLLIREERSNRRGMHNYSWTINGGDWGRNSASYVGLGCGNDVIPSASDTRAFAMSLRCLVSTTNS